MRQALNSKNSLLLGACLGLSAFLVTFVLGQIVPSAVILSFVGSDNFLGMSTFMIKHSVQLLSLPILIPVWRQIFRHLDLVRPGLSAASSLVLTYSLYSLLTYSGITTMLSRPLNGWWLSLLTLGLAGAVVTPLAVKIFTIKNDSHPAYLAFVILGVIPFAADALATYLSSITRLL